MAYIRSIKASFFTSDDIVSLVAAGSPALRRAMDRGRPRGPLHLAAWQFQVAFSTRRSVQHQEPCASWSNPARCTRISSDVLRGDTTSRGTAEHQQPRRKEHFAATRDRRDRHA